MNKLIKKLINSRFGYSALATGTLVSGGIANAAGNSGVAKDLSSELVQIFGQVLSLAGAFTVAGFFTGCWCVFKIIVLILNYQEDARNNKLSGIFYWLIAGGMGFGFAFSSDLFRGTIWGSGSSSSNNGIDNDVFQVNKK